ncbi:hypothetical protein ACET3X_002016 [Alternaria dauci]|uniref:Uncharacterized protein n=1 Tax=Alternaria dauci TaxID=48095 RepID=A0ABR3V0C3_9PLEO
MSRNAHLYAVKLTSRRSLVSIGIPNHRDVLAVYFHWVRQRYYRAHNVMRDELAPSVKSVASSCDVSDGDDECDFATPCVRFQRDTETPGIDLLNIGAEFEDEAIAFPYPGEIDVRG